MNTHEIRKKYLEFFKEKGHAIVDSSSLLPENDPTTLFTGSGMQPMVPYLLGQPHPSGTRVSDSQKCFRAQDIEEVGDSRHTTFFEMLGNWSLGDYFKAEQIPWMFDFIVNTLGLDPKNIYITCFKGKEDIGIPRDEESAGIWQEEFKKVGIDAGVGVDSEKTGMLEGEKIFYYDETKNWWSRSGVTGNMPVGEPGGPDSEMFWDFGVELGLHEKSEWKDLPCHVNCDCGRFSEIGNNVFMQYHKTDSGFEIMSQKNVDFGGGLERMASAAMNNPDIFMIDLFDGMRDKLEKISGKKYGENPEETYAFRVILDHMRAASFLISDQAVPSNKDQGYFTRRLIRRAIRFASKLGIDQKFASAIAQAVINTYQEAYPALKQDQEKILSEMSKEEDKFSLTLQKGVKKFEEIASKLERGSKINGVDAFDLYQTYGFPLEVTLDMAEEKEIEVDLESFEQEKQKHQAISRQGAEKKFKGGLADQGEMSVKYHTATHLLHAILLKVLGPHATQKGSNITPDRLRFDFAHGEKLTPEQKKEVEDLLNSAIEKDYPVSFEMMSVEEAKEKSAIGLFGDKYEEKVKVYTIGDPGQAANADPSSPTFSREICGGPHVEHTGVLGKFRIKKEESVGAGARRIKAVLE